MNEIYDDDSEFCFKNQKEKKHIPFKICCKDAKNGIE